MGEAALVLLMGALYLGGLFLFFWLWGDPCHMN